MSTNTTTNQTVAVIAAQIRRKRKAMGWSQARLAEAAGVAERTVSAAEQGKKIRPGNLHAIRTTLGLPDGDDQTVGAPDSPREQKISLALELAEKWLRALPEDQIDPAAEELTRWVVTRM
jgi:transcriptional regulator with XRE-family HTH domain